MTSADAKIVSLEIVGLQFVPTLLPLGKNFRALMDLKLQSIGLEVGQDQLLLAITETNSNLVSKLADQLNVRPSTLSKMTDKLAEKGLVLRGKSPADGRVTVLHLTEEGSRMQAEVRELYGLLEGELRDALEPDGNEDMRMGLTAIAVALSKRLSRLR
ncbi:MarR family winged helix-turn-helix transcriptional regulator [Antarcticirhabdus aurantiaca]|uniref:MarR family transcriptional regulator n=1 Tax=Antarcticirhabdus aurantiaca TaxID=2606717 RepID=A0ACD4NM70_9HYPH|nr:MarR family transcriptional regulator [Antarcticirhabdus aurantiaca]WAJ27862.1 MarR family transcriptional regulator [Jeongeuplla avenae]